MTPPRAGEVHKRLKDMKLPDEMFSSVKIKKQVIDVRRMWGRTEESARKRSIKLTKKYKFEILDELISDNLHILMANLTHDQIKDIKNDSMVTDVENMPRISLN